MPRVSLIKRLAMNSYSILIVVIIFFVASFFIGDEALASHCTPSTQSGLFNNVGTCCIESGSCHLSDLAQVGFNIANMIVGYVAALALLFFVIGGAMLLVSGGNEQNIDRGKRIIRASFLGVIIILTAWLLVNLIVVALTGNAEGTFFQNQPWFQIGA